jgi:serine/threonine protein kinase
MSATLFHKITESFAGTLFVGHSEGDLLFLEQVTVRSTTPPQLVDAMVHTLFDMRQLSSSTVAAPSHIVRFMGQVGIVTPYIEALPLRMVQAAARAKHTRCTTGVALKIILDIVDGLCQYHSLESALKGGVCPDQILVGSDGDVRVGNVAVAAMPTKESPWRANVHRLAYLAPEQVTSASGYDTRADVYAVGVILWELLANQPRFIASASRILETLRKSGGAANLAPLDTTHLHPGLLHALERALHPNPAERPASMGSFVSDLLEAGEEPASSAEVAEYVEQLVHRPLQLLRAAIRAQGGALKARSPSSLPPDPPMIRSEPPSVQKVERVPAIPSSIPPDGEHTAIYHVTAELLEKARRGSSPSDAPPARVTGEFETVEQRTVSLETEDALDQGNRTVTFQVPEELLEEARRMFEARENDEGPSSIDPAESTPSLTPGDRDDGNALELTVPSTKKRRESAEALVKNRRESASTAPTKPQNGWLWFLIVCLALALLWSLLRRVKVG